MFKLSTDDRSAMGLILSPSWLSGLIAVVAGLVICIGVISVFHFNDSTAQKQLIGWQQSQPQRTLTTPDQELPQNDKPTLSGSWPLIILWSLMGLVVYSIAMMIVHSVQSTKQLKDTLAYTHVQRESVLKSTVEHLMIRLLSVVLLIGGAYLFWHRVVPYSITAARVAALDTLSFSGILGAVLSFAVIALGLHVLTVLLRLSLARPRVFSSI